MTPEDEIRARARALGIHRVGIARADPLELEHARYEAFIDAGMHGAMGYLAEHREARRRVDTDAILAGARSVVVCALSYHREDPAPRVARGDHVAEDSVRASGAERVRCEGAPREPAGPAGGTIARYARGRDYHNFFRRRLRKLAETIRQRWPGAAARPMVDTAPVLERAWAQRAGVGFTGKHGITIAPGLGSYVLLGEVATTLELAPDEPMATRCGGCTLCLEACPTQAFVRPFVLDARRCVSYLTIEQPEAFPSELRAGVGAWLFGCDACQEVCPYNRTAPPPLRGTAEFAPDARWASVSVRSLLALTEDGYAALTQGTALSRPGRAGLARNAAVVLGNTGAADDLPALRRAAESDPSAAVRESARWAIEAITARLDRNGGTPGGESPSGVTHPQG